MIRKLNIGVAGLGRGFTVMLPTLVGDPRVALVAATDMRKDALSRFASEFKGKTYPTVEALCADPDVEVLYVATPHQFHAEHVKCAAQGGKHLLVEKPMATSVAECETMILAARRAGVHLIVGHSHSFDAPYVRTRKLIDNGEFGAVRMIAAMNYTDFVYRPRRPEEFDTEKGGGVIFSQGAHQVDIVRLLAGARAKSVRAVTGAWDGGRPMDGAFAALVTFENGAVGSLIYSGYGHFDSDEWQGWMGEMGQKKTPWRERRETFSSGAEEVALKNARNYGGANYQQSDSAPDAYQNFGPIIVSCERGDLRPLPNGVMIYSGGAGKLDEMPAPQVERAEVIDELYDAVVNGKLPRHSGKWAMATLEICLAMIRSSREGREIELEHQDTN